MRCTSLRLLGIRNFEDSTFEPDPVLTVLTGPNGCGKTNVLESVYLASIGQSFRTRQDSEIIQFTRDEGTVFLQFESDKTSHELKVKLSRSEGKKIFLNDNPVRRKDLLGIFRTVLFTPDEMKLIKGMPKDRRRFLDMELSQVNPRYYHELLRYNRAVAQRNAAFREAQMSGKKADVDMWDMQIASGASYIVRKRMETLEKMNETASAMESILTRQKEKLQIVYNQSGRKDVSWDEEWFLSQLASRREDDARLCHTSTGPHRDDLSFKINDMDLAAYGSQGQQRTAILAMKLSEVQFIREETGENPVLLLDDVTGELDRERQEDLLQYVRDHEVQTILTTTSMPDFCEGMEISLGN
jgi:DNA replication and repair protein RecF